MALTVITNGSVTKTYGTQGEADHALSWYRARPRAVTPVIVREHPRGFTYRKVYGYHPTEYWVVHSWAARHIWGERKLGAMPQSQVGAYADYVNTKWRRCVKTFAEFEPVQDTMGELCERRGELTLCEAVHADLTFENVLVTRHGPVFIDPGNDRGLTCVELDEAKLLQSYYGWEEVKASLPGLHPVKTVPRPRVTRVHMCLLVSHYVRLLSHEDKHPAHAVLHVRRHLHELLHLLGYACDLALT